MNSSSHSSGLFLLEFSNMTTKQKAVTARGGRKLTPKQKRFVEEYLVDLNATQAAIRAGYSQRTAGQIGEQNLKKLEIKQAIQEAQSKRAERTELTQDYVIQELIKVVEVCTGQKETVITEVLKNTMDNTVHAHDTERKLYDASAANRALELLGKHLGMFKDKVELSGANGAPVEVITLTEDRYKQAREEMLADDDC